jgi:hypothetical protein
MCICDSHIRRKQKVKHIEKAMRRGSRVIFEDTDLEE